MEHILGLIESGVVLAIAVAVAWYILSKIRRGARKSSDLTSSTQERLQTFTAMYENGQLTREEFRALRATLAVSFDVDAKKESEMDERSAQLERLLRNDGR